MGGCPDTDGDGLSDLQDACPLVAGVADQSGCPKYKQVVVTEKKIEILQKLYFAYGLTTVLPKSYPLLDEVRQVLSDRTSLCVRIEGHTDNKGSEEKNFKLSEGRAQAVRQYMIDEGTTANRLEAKGYGSKLPLDDNTTAAGRENNRRVEFVLVPCGG